MYVLYSGGTNTASCSCQLARQPVPCDSAASGGGLSLTPLCLQRLLIRQSLKQLNIPQQAPDTASTHL